ncbi:MAG: hypothetical protein K0V04_24295 [Deltaproteobacteria bacterium]|nr:hypothetical protein [Deltaproteobacteria bacterium]
MKIETIMLGAVACTLGCSAPEPFDTDLTLRAGALPQGTIGALDVTTPRVLSYRLTRSDGAFVGQTDTTVTFAAGKVHVPLLPFYGVDEIGRFDVEPTGFATHPLDGAIPSVLLMLESMPDAEIAVGSTWERSRPSDAEATTMDALVLQQRREYTVVDWFSTAQGLVVRVEIEGWTRWFDNDYAREGTDFGMLAPQFRPESFGYVDVNLDVGVVVDARFHSGMGLAVATPPDLPGTPGAVEMTLCPGPGSTFVPMADTCS